MSVQELQQRASAASTPSTGVYLVGDDVAAVVPITDAAAMVGVAKMIKQRQLKDTAKVAELTAFADRLRKLLAAERPLLRLDVSAREQQIATFLLTQSRARAGLPSRIRDACTTCGHQILINPDEQKLRKHAQRMNTLARSVGVAVFAGTVSPVLMAGSLVGFLKLNPDFDCPRCHGLEAEETVIVFCPHCKALHDEAVLKACRCGHSFLAGLDVDIWHTKQEVPLLAGACLNRVSSVHLGNPVAALAAAADGRRFLTVTQAKPETLTLWDARDPESDAPPRTLNSLRVPWWTGPCALSGDGGTAALGTDDGIMLIPTDTMTGIKRLPGLYSFAASLSSDGASLAATNSAGVDVWTVSGGHWSSPTLDPMGVPKEFQMRAAYQPGGEHLALWRGRQISVRTAKDGVEVRTISPGAVVAAVAWTGDGSGLILATHPGDGGTRLTVLGAFDGLQRVTLDVNPDVKSDHIRISPRGTRLALVGRDDTMALLDADTGRQQAREILPPHTDIVEFLGENRLVLAYGDTVEVWALPAGEHP